MRPLKDSRHLIECIRARFNGLPTPVNRKTDAWKCRRVAIISSRGKFLYLPITKAANTSIKHAIAEFDNGGPIDEDFVIHKYGAMHAIPWDASYEFDGYKFSVVRHPFKRMISCYRNKVLKNELHQSLQKFGVFKAEMPFKDFLGAVADIPDEDADIHFTSQSFFLYGDRGCRVDNIVKMEELKNKWGDIASATGLPAVLPHRNASKDRPFTPDNDRELSDLIVKRFGEDFERLNYQA